MRARKGLLTPPVTRPAPLATKFHLAGLLLIFFGGAAAGFFAQQESAAPTNTAAEHGQAIPIYLMALVIDWAVFFYCYVGVRRAGGNLASLSAGRWTSAKDVFTDIAIAIPFVALWEGVEYGCHYVLNHLSPTPLQWDEHFVVPTSLIEITLWILVSLTAGFCEEIIFRGYLQKQFHALTGSIAIAVILQGVVFGISHGYQGWKNVVIISALGILYGMLAAWRRNLRINIIFHALSDAWGGWLKFIFFL
jgi:uncharacterized protein